jgi:hypothetical protein
VKDPADLVDEIAELYGVPEGWLIKLGEMVADHLRAVVAEYLDDTRSGMDLAQSALTLARSLPIALDNPLEDYKP